MPFDIRRLENVRDYAHRVGHAIDVHTLNDAIREIADLRQALLWYIQNDETNVGDNPLPEYGGQTLRGINAYWIDGQNRARTLLGLESV